MNGDEAPIEIETGRWPTASVLWLHGLGADGHDFVPIVPALGLPAEPAVRFVFPHAPYRPVTLNGGYVMRAWYDIGPGTNGFTQNRTHLDEAEAALRALVAREAGRGIDTRRIVLGGFSQGATVALQTGLRFGQPLAGLLILSVAAAHAAELAAGVHPANAATPLFLAHGSADPLVPFALGCAAHAALAAAGLTVEWHSYPMGHSVCPEEIRDIGRWLSARLAPA
jgi:phospholipase/carboxylesterase